MTDTDFERRLETLLAATVDRPVDTGASWRRVVVRRQRSRRSRRLVAVMAVGAVALAAVVLPQLVPRTAGGGHSAQPGGEHGLAITARIAIPGPGSGPGDTGIAGEVAGQGGQIWVITYSGGLARIDPRTSEVTLREHLTGLTDLAVGAGAVWALLAGRRASGHPVGPNGGQLLRIDPVTGHLTARFDLPRRCQAVSFGGGRLWVACGGGATEFLRLDPATGRVLASGGPAYGVTAISATADGIWYEGNSGISGFVGTGHKLTWVNASDSADLVDTDSLVYSAGSLWAFDGGENVARISPVTGRITKIYSAARYDPQDDLSLNFLAVDRSSIWFLRDAGYRATAVLRVSLATGRPVGEVAGVGSCGEPCWQIYLARGSAWVPTQTQVTRIGLVKPGRPG